MKPITLFSIAFLLMVGCADDPESPSFDENQYVGIWVPFEVIYQDGTVDQGPFTNRNIFGVYDESLQLKEDNVYAPVNWIDENNYLISPEEGGKFVASTSRLLLSEGSWDMEFEIVEFGNEELWLMYLGELPLLGGPQTLYKLKRNIK